MISEPGRPGAARYVLFDVDGTLIDAVENQRLVWRTWAERYGLDPDEVHRVALRTRPMETFARVASDKDPRECLAVLHELEDEDVRSGTYAAFDGAVELLSALRPGAWALVTSNYEHRVRGRFARTGLPVPEVLVDAAAVEEGNRRRCRICRPPRDSAPDRRNAWSSRTPPPGCSPACVPG